MTDFAASPGPGLILIDGANQLRNLRALWWVARHWPSLRREMVTAPGYVKHRIWYRRPLTVGLTTWWEDEKAAYRFAHMPAHLEFWRWATTGVTTGGWLAMYRLTGGGPLWGNGVETMMRDFGRFVGPASGEPPQPIPAERRAAGNR